MKKQKLQSNTKFPFGGFRKQAFRVLTFLFAGLLCLLCAACNTDDNPADDPTHPSTEEGITEMQVNYSYSYYDGPQTIEIVSMEIEINWGDGAIENYTSNGRDTIEYRHRYSTDGTYLITIKSIGLTGLFCSGRLSSLNVSKNTALIHLECGYWSSLLNLDVSKNTALTYLDCRYSQLTTLDVSKNTALTYLNCGNRSSGSNRLTNLDVSKNTALTYLSCDNNRLTHLDVSKNTALTYLSCGDNRLTNLDVSGCTALTELHCYDNQLTNLNVSGCTALTYLDCLYNRLTNLNVSGCTALTELHCYDNQLTNLNVSGCTALTELHCYDNQLTNLNVSGCTALTDLDCRSNQLSATALNALFASLPVRMPDDYARIYIWENPGAGTCDESIARNKGWYVN